MTRRFASACVQGEVHDENAFAMGGVAGHAGMFTTAADLAAFCQMLLNGGIYAHHRLLTRATISQFTAPAAARRQRLHAWMDDADAEFLERPLFFAAQLRASGLYRHFDLDRSGPPTFRDPADQSRLSHARQ